MNPYFLNSISMQNGIKKYSLLYQHGQLEPSVMNFLVAKILLVRMDWTAGHTKMNNFPHLASK